MRSCQLTVCCAAVYLACAASTCSAWNKPGHMVSGAIAYRVLRDRDPNLVAKVIAVLEGHPEYETRWAPLLETGSLTSNERDQYLFMLAARWPDDIRGDEQYHHGEWHYINFPYEPANQPTVAPTAPPCGDNDEGNVLCALRENYAVLTENTDISDRAVAICWMLHLIGDVHQPLHTAKLISTEFPAPEGDRGGTHFYVLATHHSSAISLHTFWDGLILNRDRFRSVRNRAVELQSQYSPSAAELAVQDFKMWADGSFALAKSIGYRNGNLAGSRSKTHAPTLPANYAGACKPVAEQQLVLAGYRIANILAAAVTDWRPDELTLDDGDFALAKTAVAPVVANVADAGANGRPAAGGGVEHIEDFVLEELPGHVVATMEARDRWFATLAEDSAGEFYFLADSQKWEPGQSVRVAFLGGDTALHKDIAAVTKSITDACNIAFDFGYDPMSNTYRTWSTSDTIHKAEIRVSFDLPGNFSLIGRDSHNTAIGAPFKPVGGRANQRSLNLGGFDQERPPSWQRTARHEFLHAIAFRHEHQSPAGGCDAQFRWDNDDGYVPTQDEKGRYLVDANGKRPGIYTYLSGYPNFWEQEKVDHNLRQLSAGTGSVGPFDRASIMLYRFPELFYKNSNSACAPSGGTDDLSAGDIAGLLLLYPRGQHEVDHAVATQTKTFDAIERSPKVDARSKQSYRQMRQRSGK